MNLVLDFVPNHVAPDHAWSTEHPEYFIHGSADDVKDDLAAYVEVCATVCACGRDPYFPAWSDVLQLRAIDPVCCDGQWCLFERTGRPDNASFQNLIAWSWFKDQRAVPDCGQSQRLSFTSPSSCAVG
jgi:hypothetical protein